MLDGTRIIPPTNARRSLVITMHKGHPGERKMLTWAKQLYFWPGMTNEIIQHVDSCTACSKYKPAQQQTKGEVSLPSSTGGPMNNLGIDYFSFSAKPWVAIVDRFSGFLWTKQMSSETTSALTSFLTSLFNQYGWPTSIRSDGGPQFRSEFAKFCLEHNIVHEVSSSYNPKSNGLAESAVKSIKNLLKRCNDLKENFTEALAHFLQTPRSDGYSPFQLFFCRAGRLPKLPLIRQNLDLIAGTQRRDATRAAQQQSIQARSNKPLNIGDPIIFQDLHGNWTRSGSVKAKRPDGLSYIVESNGRDYIRSRSLLRRQLTPSRLPKIADLDSTCFPNPELSSQSITAPPRRRSQRLVDRKLSTQGTPIVKHGTFYK